MRALPVPRQARDDPGRRSTAQPFAGGLRLTFRKLEVSSTGPLAKVLRGSTGFYRVLQGSVLQGSTGFWFYGVLLGSEVLICVYGRRPPLARLCWQQARAAPCSSPRCTLKARSRAVAPRALQVLAGRGSQIGVTIRDVDENDAKAGKMTQPSGVVIEEVAEDSPASKAGLKKGDIVVEFDGERVRSVRQFTRLVQETPAGRNAQAAVVRDGQKLTITVEPREGNGFNVFGDLDPARVIGDMAREFRFDGLAPPPPPPAPPARPGRPAPPEPPAPPAAPFPDVDTFIWRSGNGLGITVGDLSDQLAGYFGVKDGVLVTSVTDDSAAAKAGIKAGDVDHVVQRNGCDTARRPAPADSAAGGRRRIYSGCGPRQEAADAERQERDDAKPAHVPDCDLSRSATWRRRALEHASRAAPRALPVARRRSRRPPACRGPSLLRPSLRRQSTPTQPAGVTSGAAIAPFDTASASTTWSSDVRNADAVTLWSSLRMVPSRVTIFCEYPCVTIGLSSRPSGSAIHSTIPGASSTVAARPRRAGSAWVSTTRARSVHRDATVARSSVGAGGADSVRCSAL